MLVKYRKLSHFLYISLIRSEWNVSLTLNLLFILIVSISLVSLVLNPLTLVHGQDTLFNDPIPLDEGSGWSLRPVIASSGSNLYTIWEEHPRDQTSDPRTGPDFIDPDILFRASHDDGYTFEPSVNLSKDSSCSKYPYLAASGSNVYVIWQEQAAGCGRASYDEREVFFRASNDYGNTFGSVINISNSPSTYSGPGQIIASGSDVCVSWSESGIGNFFRISNDGGNTFGSPIGPNVEPEDELCRVGDPYYIKNGNYEYKIWVESIFPNGDRVYLIQFARSTDGGVSFEPTITLDSFPLVIGNSPRLAILVSGNSVYLAWEHHRTSNDSDVSFTVSHDNGVTFGDTIDINHNVAWANLMYLQVVDNSVYLLWLDYSWDKTDVYFRASTDNGDSFGNIINLSKNRSGVSPAVMLSSESSIHVLWSADDENTDPGRLEIFYTRSPPLREYSGDLESLDTSIDILPKSDLNIIDCSNAKGNVPVVIFTDEDFDAQSVNISAVELEEINVYKNIYRFGDFDHDGDVDLKIKFKKAHLCEHNDNLSAGNPGTQSTNEMVLHGLTKQNQPFKGTDFVLFT